MKLLRPQREIYLFGAAHNGDVESEALLIAAYAPTIKRFARTATVSDEDWQAAITFLRESLPTAIKQARSADMEKPWEYLRGRIIGLLEQFKRKHGIRLPVASVKHVRRDPTPEEIEARKLQLSLKPMRRSTYKRPRLGDLEFSIPAGLATDD